MEATATDQTRIWLYRSVKKLSPEIEAEILEKGNDFISQWASHGNKLAAEFQILHHHFLVFFVDQSSAKASGCSIDSSVALVRELESKFALGLFDRMQIPFKEGEEIVFHEFNQLNSLYETGVISDESIIFDQLVENKDDFENRFMIPFSESPYYRSIQ